MEWLTDKDDPENMEVDIGYMPLMELKLVNPGTEVQSNEIFIYFKLCSELDLLSVNFIGLFYHQDFQDSTTMPPITKWDAEISAEEANKALELRMFPFKQVSLVNVLKKQSLMIQFQLVYCFTVK